MYRIPPTPKQLAKFSTGKAHKKFKPVPEKWEDFARLLQIKSGNQMLPFNPYPYQIELSNLMDSHNNIDIVKSRQLGITQIISCKFLHRAIQNPAYSAMVFLKNQADASNIARRMRVMLSSIPEYVENESDNLGYMKILGGGDIFFKNSSKDGGRSFDSISDFLFDEAAFSPNIADVFASSSSASAMVGEASTKVVVSTPSAKFGWYWDKLISGCKVDVETVCQQVVKGELPPFHYWVNDNGDVKTIIHWKAHPKYSQRDDYLAYRKEKDGTSWEVINREYNLTFADSEVSVFNSDIIRKNALDSPLAAPATGGKFYIGVDTSNLGNDYTVAAVLWQHGEQFHLIDLYRQRKQSSEYDIYHIGELIRKYKPQKVGIEVTGGTGQVYLEQLCSQFSDTAIDAIRTTGDSKPAMINRLSLALETERLKFPFNSPFKDELLTFRRVGAKLEASAGKHDDVLMAVCFALTVSPFKPQRETGFSFTSMKTFKDYKDGIL